MSEPNPPISTTTEYYRPMEVFVPAVPRHPYWLHALLLLATIFTTLVVGARLQVNFLHQLPAFFIPEDGSSFPVLWALQGKHLLLGIPFCATLMLILLAHEMGHYLYARKYGVWATLPFFIPFPTLIGTLGAFIRIKSPIRSRVALFDIGIAGPIAGFVISVPVLFAGLMLSSKLPAGAPASPYEPGFPWVFSVAQWLLSRFGPSNGVHGASLEAMCLHPVAIAAWVGMFATALNLLPGGQLDGGHIVFAVAPRAHRWISWLTILALLPLGFYCWTGWIIWAVLLRISGTRHPMVAEYPGLTKGRRWLAIFALIMLVVTVTPAPFLNADFRNFAGQMRESIREGVQQLFHRN